MLNTKIFKKQIKNNWIYCLFSFTFPPILILLICFSILTDSSINSISRAPLSTVLSQMNTQVSLMIPVIFCIICSNRMVVSEIQSGAMTYVVASPVPRKTIIGTKMSFLLFAQIYGFLLNILSITIIYGLYKNKIDMSYGALFMNDLGVALLIFVLSGISFFFATYFDKLMLSHVTGTVLIAVFYIISIVASIAYMVDSLESLRFIRFFTINSLFNYSDFSKTTIGLYNMTKVNIAAKPIIFYSLMFVLGSGLFIGSGIVFSKKDLPL